MRPDLASCVNALIEIIGISLHHSSYERGDAHPGEVRVFAAVCEFASGSLQRARSYGGSNSFGEPYSIAGGGKGEQGGRR